MIRTIFGALLLALATSQASAQVTTDPPPVQVPPVSNPSEGSMAMMPMGIEAPGWHFMQDGVIFGVYNNQGGPRGGEEFRVPNWWMGMASIKSGRSQFTFSGMLSLDRLTVGKRGYRELFQTGEELEGRPVIDHQHPHDFAMQLAAVWRVAVGGAGLTIAGAPAGEAALGPVAFVHRPSSAENPMAPLSHHLFDSTHIVFGVVTAAVDRKTWVLEASVFNGREPDEHRWDVEAGRLDSVSGRFWFRPIETLEFQVSTGRLKDPEGSEPGVVRRTTATAEWFSRSGADFTAVTAGFGMNDAPHGARRGVFAEATWHAGANSIFGRAEVVDVATDVLKNDGSLALLAEHQTDRLSAFTMGGVRDVFVRKGFEGGLGAAVQTYIVPASLIETYGDRPVSFQVFFRLRLPTGAMGRMWDARMSQPGRGHTPAHTIPMIHDVATP